MVVEYEAKPWAFDTLEDAAFELKKNKDCFDFEIWKLNGRDWLTNRRTNELGTSYFARTEVGPGFYVVVRGDGEDSRDGWLQVLNSIAGPAN